MNRRLYFYHTARNGNQVIGVEPGLGGDIWIVGWFTETGSLRRIKSQSLTPCRDPEIAQELLDAWAAKHGLREVK